MLKIHRYRNIPNNYKINTPINLVVIIIMYWSSRSIPNKYAIKKTINQKSYQGHKLIEITRRGLEIYFNIFCLTFSNFVLREKEVVFEYKKMFLKGVFAKNERGYRLNAIKKRFWSLLILLLSVASIRRKLLKRTNTEERSIHTNSERCNIRLRP